MNEALEKLDMSMKELYSELVICREDDPRYLQILNSIARQYQACKTLISMDVDNVYSFKYSNMEDIESLLTTTGYLKQAPKAKR